MHYGDLVSCPLLGNAVYHLCIDPTLETSLNSQNVPHDFVTDGLSQLAPDNHGQVIRAPIPPPNGQHHVADTAAKRRSAEDRRFTQGSAKNHTVYRRIRPRLHSHGIDGKYQAASKSALIIEGPELAQDPNPRPHLNCRGKGGAQKNWERIRLPGKTLDPERDAVKFNAVIFVGEDWRCGYSAAQFHFVSDLLHAVHLCP